MNCETNHAKMENLDADFVENPIVYHVLTDRFYEARNTGCTQEIAGNVVGKPGSFFGGTLAGITRKIREDWFSALGVNALLISAPYEQIHGWVPGGNEEFKHHGYHGYYALDYTVVDSRFGDETNLRELVEAAHEANIRVLLDVVMNHPGYADLQTMHDLEIDVLKPGWENATPRDFRDHFNFDSSAFLNWWGPDWVRASLAGYTPGGVDELTMQLSGLPDFRTESKKFVELPAFLKKKRNTRAVELPGTTVRGYLIKWLTDWVREYGVDGFRCDSAKHVELDAWLALKRAAIEAKAEWMARAPNSASGDSSLWMLGEVFGQGVEPSHYFDFGFDCLINFEFQPLLAQGMSLDAIYETYSRELNGRPGFNVVSFISSHDTYLFDRRSLLAGATALMLSPGGVLILYGDETAREQGPSFPADPIQAIRSPMNWDTINQEVLAHWRRLGRFRARHVAVARGQHRKLQDMPYVFSRIDQSGDRVLIAIDTHGETRLEVASVFPEGAVVRDAYSDWNGQVSNGQVVLQAHGCVLLELVAGVGE
jgi:alpha-amylase